MTKLEPHPYALLVPRPTAEEYAALEKDILQHGLLVPLVLFQGKVLDGWTRLQIANKHGIELKPEHFTIFTGTEEQARDLMFSLNAHRRHLTPDRKAEFIENLLRSDPSLTDNSIAEKVIASPHTVKKIRIRLNLHGANKDRHEASGRKARGRKPGPRPTRNPSDGQQHQQTDATAQANDGPHQQTDTTAQDDAAALQQSDQERETLSEIAKQKFDRMVKHRVELELKALRRRFEQEVRQRVDREMAEERKISKAIREKAQQAEERFKRLSKGLKGLMTHEEFRIVLGCLHSDRVPDDLKPRYDKAFAIFKRLEVDGREWRH